MYPHHMESIGRLLEYFKTDSGVIAVIIGGSVAKGLARPDSDIDAMVIVNDAKLKELEAAGKGAECIFGHCTYPGGYFDVKYYNRQFLIDAAERGSEPARNAFLGARCLFTLDPEIPSLVAEIPVFQERERTDKLLSFYAAFELNRGYYWRVSHGDRFLRMQAAVDTVLFGLRLLLEDRRKLFPCAKSLYLAVESLEDKPDDILSLADALLERLDDASRDAFCAAVTSAISYSPPDDYALIMTRYIEDHELWWRKARPLIAEW